MSDDNKGNTPGGDDSNKDNQGAENKDNAGGQETEKLLERIKYLEKETKDIISQRDEFKKKVNKIDTDESIKRGEYEKVINEKTAELEKLKTEVETANTYKEKFELLDKNIRAEALKQLTDEHKKIAEFLPTDKLQEYVKLNGKDKSGMDTGTNGRGTIDVTGKKWSDFNSTELELLRKDNVTGYKRLYREHFNREVQI